MSFVTELEIKKVNLMADLEGLHAESRQLDGKMHKVRRAIEGIDYLLNMEGGEQQDLNFPLTKSSNTLYQLIFDFLADRKFHGTNEIVERVMGTGFVFPEGQEPYKKVNMTLMGMSRGKNVKRSTEGKFKRVD